MDDPNKIGINLESIKGLARKIFADSKKKGCKWKDIIKTGLEKVDFNRKISDKMRLKDLYLRIALTVLMIASIIALGITGYEATQISMIAFDVYLENDNIGTIRHKEDAYKILDELGKELSNTYDMEIALKKSLKFEETKAKDGLLTSFEDMQSEIRSRMSFLVYGYILKVNDVEIGALKTKEEINEILDRIQEPYRSNSEEDLDLKEIKIVEDIEIIKRQMPLYEIGNKEDIYNHLMTSSEEMRFHRVEVGESFWTIAMMYNLTVDELIEANQDKNPNKLQIGEEVRLFLPKSVVTVATVAEVEYMENIRYETIYEYDDKMYKNEKKTKVAGVRGSSKILANEIKHNGILVEKEIVKEERLEEPITEVIIKGTKELPKTAATGLFLMPTVGRISSRYGMRNGSMHRGLDIAASRGTAIKAADGGKVVFAGYRGAYGNLVEIDHGNGYKTRYAHCSKILVKVGSKVYKGQHIANMGSTGRSTGSHLHFEVIKNGSNQNPANFVK